MITVCILSKNSAATIAQTLDSVQTFPEVLVLDNGSTDQTIAIAKNYPNVKVVEAPFTGFGPLRNQLANLAAHDWIFALDTDEVVSAALLAEIRALQLDPQQVYTIPRDNYYHGKHIRGCGWYPDRVIRLYHRKKTAYSNAPVHESVQTDSVAVIRLTAPIQHTPFRSTAEFLAKMQQYSSLFATQYKQQRKSSVYKAFFHSAYAFFRSYFFQKGFLLGSEGFIISLYNSNTVFYKYLKLWEENS